MINEYAMYSPPSYAEHHGRLLDVRVNCTVADEAARVENVRVGVLHRIAQDGPI